MMPPFTCNVGPPCENACEGIGGQQMRDHKIFSKLRQLLNTKSRLFPQHEWTMQTAEHSVARRSPWYGTAKDSTVQSRTGQDCTAQHNTQHLFHFLLVGFEFDRILLSGVPLGRSFELCCFFPLRRQFLQLRKRRRVRCYWTDVCMHALLCSTCFPNACNDTTVLVFVFFCFFVSRGTEVRDYFYPSQPIEFMNTIPFPVRERVRGSSAVIIGFKRLPCVSNSVVTSCTSANGTYSILHVYRLKVTYCTVGDDSSHSYQ